MSEFHAYVIMLQSKHTAFNDNLGYICTQQHSNTISYLREAVSVS